MKCHVETPLLATIFIFHVSNVQVGGQKHRKHKASRGESFQL